MPKKLIFFICLLSISISKAQPNQWQFNQKTTKGLLITDSNYNLFNTSIQKSLIHRSTKKGISLGWQGGRNAPFNIVLHCPTDKDSLTSCREVAILITDAEYLTYTEREYGITLGWSKSPVYEWRITTEDKACNVLKTGQKYGLFNLKAQKYLVYQERADGFVALDWLEE
jgi:hypothetical protein